jgi:hypothetical protein
VLSIASNSGVPTNSLCLRVTRQYRDPVRDVDGGHSEDGVHLEWWYDLPLPFLANASLLEGATSYESSIVTEDGVFTASVRLPRIPDYPGGLATFLAPPQDWAATTPDPDEQWGTPL